jgi:prefoldin alpha subunit
MVENNKNDEKELQNKYMQYQQLQQQMQEVQKQLEVMKNQMMEIDYIKNAIRELSVVEKGNEILCPLSSGIFVKAKLLEPGNYYINVGGSTVVQKSTDDAANLMEKQSVEIENAMKKMHDNYQVVIGEMQKIEQSIMKV